ncbi:MAG: hypothetical protein ACI398_10915 [Clostridium sp.]
MRNKIEIAKRIACLFIAIGAVHIGTFSIGPGFYEPEIPSSLLKK